MLVADFPGGSAVMFASCPVAGVEVVLTIVSRSSIQAMTAFINNLGSLR